MGRRPKPLNPNDPLHAFAIELIGLRDAAGPAGRIKATCDQVGVTRTTYYAWLAGKQLPGRDVLELTVRAWGGDPAYWLACRRKAETALAEAALQRLQQARMRQAVQDARAYEVSRRALPPQAGQSSEPSIPSSGDRARRRRVDEARRALSLLGFDAERSNERSALVLLALLELGPEAEWQEAERPILRTVQIMQWLRDAYGKDYKPNTRETIRRFTLHQFVEAGLVVQNPDQPDRPVNSPKWCFQVSQRAHALLCSHGTSEFVHRAQAYRQ
ncbi:hypothetical protein ACFO3J_22310 [Streptomyces polygonati]|uniref:BsuBI/PstI restriction endonuclease HTH domain-containing protein n=1 Tax=Streptomyces polygonati TaxID=1617087 RepID=A0ABV8HT95_9ACTN